MRKIHFNQGLMMLIVGILILVIGLVSLVVSMNAQSKPVDKEQTQMAASLLAKKMNDAAVAAQRMIAQGPVTSADLQLTTDPGTGLYGPDGTLDPLTISNSDYVTNTGSWTLTHLVTVMDSTGAKDLGTSAPELTLVTTGLTDAVCKQLNKLSINQSIIVVSDGVSTEGSGISGSGTLRMSNASGEPADSGCFSADGGSTNIGFKVIASDETYTPA